MKTLSIKDSVDFASVVHDVETDLISVDDNGEVLAFVISAKSVEQAEEAKKAIQETKQSSYKMLMNAMEELDRTNPKTGAIREGR